MRKKFVSTRRDGRRSRNGRLPHHGIFTMYLLTPVVEIVIVVNDKYFSVQGNKPEYPIKNPS